MVQLLILYYLSIKSTHGYEIQKFIQLNHMSEWNNIHSGSIYYAMNKLERDGLIAMIEKIGEGEKTKQIYAITEKGRAKLRDMALLELGKPLGNISSEKFLVYPIVANLTKDEILESINKHLDILEAKIKEIDKWCSEKQHSVSFVEKATLNMMKKSVTLQIDWHKTLMEHIDETILEVNHITKIISQTDFSENK